MAKTDIPAIIWGSGFVNTIDIGQPLDNAVTYSEPRENSEFTKTPSGVEDSWVTGDDEFLAGDIRYIPTADATSPNAASGWDAADGWHAFLKWARKKNVFRFVPDKTDTGTYIECYLVEPMRGEPAREPNGERRLRLVIRSTDDSPFTGY